MILPKLPWDYTLIGWVKMNDRVRTLTQREHSHTPYVIHTVGENGSAYLGQYFETRAKALEAFSQLVWRH